MIPARRLLLWATVTLGLVAILLPITAPAGVFAYLVEQGTKGRLQLHQHEGTVWQGRGQLAASPAYVSASENLDLRWVADWSSVWRGLIEWKISLNGQDLRVGISPAGWLADSSGFRVPIDLVRAFLPAAVSRYGWRGDIRFEARGLKAAWGDAAAAGTARLDLRALGVKELLRGAAGSYSITAVSERGTWSLALDSLAGPLELKGTGRVEGGRLSCEVKAKVSPGTNIELSNLMDHVARRDSPGAWTLNCR